jgi:hypothetical protein
VIVTVLAKRAFKKPPFSKLLAVIDRVAFSTSIEAFVAMLSPPRVALALVRKISTSLPRISLPYSRRQ